MQFKCLNFVTETAIQVQYTSVHLPWHRAQLTVSITSHHVTEQHPTQLLLLLLTAISNLLTAAITHDQFPVLFKCDTKLNILIILTHVVYNFLNT